MVPQIILVGLLAMSTGMYLAKHGEPRDDTYNFWYALLSDAIILGLLYWGGFFDVFFK